MNHECSYTHFNFYNANYCDRGGSDDLLELPDFVEFHYLPVVSGKGHIRLLMETQNYSVRRLQDLVLAAFFNLILVLHAYLTVDLLYLNGVGELRWELLWHLSSEEVNAP